MVNNGVMFVATPGNQVLAIDAKTGDLLWRYKRPIPEDMPQLHPTSRGVGLFGDKVFFAATDADAGRARREDRQGGVDRPRSRTTGRATTCRWHRSSSTAR